MMASIAIGTGLLLLVVTVAPWATVCRAYSSSSASGSASGDTAEPECKAPPYSNPNNIRVNLTDEQWQELLLEGRCYLACATEQQYQNDTIMYSNISSYWPFRVSASESDCSIFGRIHECIRGCVKRSTSTPRKCSDMCRSSCTDECEGQVSCENPDMRDPWNHPNCSVTCHNDGFNPLNPCSLGCKLIAQLNGGAISPRDPIGPPLLIPDMTTERAGLFTLDLSDAAPQLGAEEGSGGAGDDSTVGPIQPDYDISPGPVVFLFRIEEGTSQNVSYIWVSNPLAHLDLVDYACQDLIISFAVGNKEAKLSSFSPKTNVTVNIGVERSIPNPPTDLQILDDIDTRVGFFGHAILNISWQRPQNSVFLENFTVSISPTMDDTATVCGSDSLNITVSSNETCILVEAESRFSLPVINCSYRIDVYSVGPDGCSEPLSSDGPYSIETVFSRDYIGFECERIWDSENFWFSFKYIWDLPPYILDDNVIIGSTLIPKWLVMDSSQRTSAKTKFNDMMASRFVFFPFEKDDSGVVSYILDTNNTDAHAGPRGVEYHRPRPADSNLMYLFEANVTWNDSNIPYVPPRLTSFGFDYECSLSTLSPPPSPVTNLELESYNIRQFDITLMLRWSPPSFPNGLLAPYDVCVGKMPLGPTQEPELGNNLASMHYCGTIDEDSNGTVKLTYLDRGDSEDVYIQMRAHNMFVPGNWSDPVIISRAATTESTVIASQEPAAKTFPAIVVGPSISGLILLSLLMCCVCLCVCYVRILRKRKRMWKIAQDYHDPMFDSGPKKHMFERMMSDTPLLMSPQMDEWEIPANEVIMEKQLGEGAFGEVYKGVIKCPIVNPKVKLSAKNPICTPVAIKLLKLSAKGSERQDFISEIEMMKKVAEGQNAHVVGLLGCVTIQEPLCLITEFVKFGDLLSYLRTNRRMYTNCGTDEDAVNDAYVKLGNVSSVDLVSFAYQIATGMEYLSSLGIIHRDLACRNILIDDGKVLKISDLGMSRETDEIYVQKRTGRVPLKWMAIESIIAREFTSASDVWSYGVILWEIGTLGGFPYPSIQNEDLLPMLRSGYRMEKPDNCSPDVYEIMRMCWVEDPWKRPTFSDLRSKFDAMLLAERNNEYIDLRINNDKPYYRLDTAATLQATANSSSMPQQQQASSHAGVTRQGSFLLSQFATKEPSPKPLPTPDLSPSRKSQISGGGASESAQFSPGRKPGMSLATSSHSVGAHSYSGGDQQASALDSERRSLERGRDRTPLENGRPSSLLLPQERERREKQKQNPYVDEPSRAAATTLALPNSNGIHTRLGSDGAIEMSHLGRSSNSVSRGECPEIQITGED